MLLALFVPLASASAQENGAQTAEDGGTLDATPEDATNPVDEAHTIDGVLDLSDSDAEGDQRIRAVLDEDDVDDESFQGGLEDGSEASCGASQDAEGDSASCALILNEVTGTVVGEQQESTGTVTAPGKDRLRVFHDVNDNGTWDADEDFDFVFKTWVSEDSEGDASRLWGTDRIGTANAVSQDHWADHDAEAFPDAEGREQAQAVVLARANLFPDALAGTPFAVLQEAPLLLTFPDSLDERTEDELQRVLAEGGTVYLLGGNHALSQNVEDRVQDLGYEVDRLFGDTRFQTAIDIAEETETEQGTLDHLFIARSHEFPDALAGGAAAANIENFDAEAAEGEIGAILLTFHDQKHADTEDFINDRPDATTYALGGPLVNPYSCAVDVEVAGTWHTQSDCTQDEDTADEDTADWAIFGADRQETSRAIAEFFFDGPEQVGLARGDEFPDALTGGAHIGQFNGPILLTQTGVLDQDAERYLCWTADTIETAYIYGGDDAIAPGTAETADDRIDGTECPDYERPKHWVGS